MKRKLKGTKPVPKRCILLLLDGLGDRSYKVLENKTPLQAAHTPHLDLLAQKGANGLFHCNQYGLALPSENAHFAIFGYDEEFPGRGLLEALGAGMTVAPGEIPMLAHFVSLEEREKTLFLAKDRPETEGEEAVIFTRAVVSYESEGITFSYTQTKRLDGIVTMGGGASPAVTDSDCFVEGEPLIDVLPLKASEDRDLAARTARALKSYLVWCYETLCSHPLNAARKQRGAFPVNGVVTQRPGVMNHVESFADRWGLRAASVSSGLMYWGLGRFLGMDVHKVKDSDDPGEDLFARLQMALHQKDDYEFIHIHTKTPDAAAHTKDPFNKMKAIESLDKGVGKIIDILDDDTILVVTGDHSTPSSGPLVHSGEPVPIAVVGSGVRVDRVSSFDEVSCAGGALGQLRHGDFMYCVLNWLDRAKLQGLMDCPEDRPYWPGRRKPFRLD
ncbi:MAG: 2,3-bisphosphoglycerate-independent phosphoglycerate mutase [Desulfobulbaceae bacterium]|uniref:2,3-bisphosphoglycerate-independent phosphoglycerate mutase n=1 Tax=Candidatus Desulfobia pelagia TaxID=2841692 RepID=A0A8J6TC42_9BACT|nr:2,3-bisphosphoglycerate-independent phosphoglycerate mutase [Candidatus Desulfobia pelagia]